MEPKEFREKLKKAGLSKKEFATLVDLEQQSVNNWGCSKNIPHWVNSWLDLYMEAKSLSNLKNNILKSGICNELSI